MSAAQGIRSISDERGAYRTPPGVGPSFAARAAPSILFYARAASTVFRGSRLAKRGGYDDLAWYNSSLRILRALESVGTRFDVTGVENLRKVDGPCIFVANHMSTLETFVLPCIILPHKAFTFVVKRSLIEYPVFGHIMRSRNPITVGRENPREDFVAVVEGCAERLRAGTSVAIFPQTTRSPVFDPGEFNTIGVKAARRAGVPAVPIALKTDAWGNGRLVKDMGRIDPSRPVHICFGEPIEVAGRGDEAHRKVTEFISGRLEAWGARVRRQPIPPP
jgi:1-acyl-sn-glycerol-3-phosphate acyltransferase